MIALSLFILSAAIIIPVLFFAFKENPTCFDGKQNQGETAPDMGGPCEKLDPRFLKPVRVLWSRSMKIKPGLYTAVAFVDNPNLEAKAKDVPYRFSFYDSEGVKIGVRYGKTDIYPGKVFPVYEDSINTNEAEVAKTAFDFLKQPVWYKAREDKTAGLLVKEKTLKLSKRATVLEARLINTSIDDKENIYLVATLFDENGNAVAASQTYVPYILAGAEKKISFTWPKPMKNVVSNNISILIPLDVPHEGKTD